MNHDMDTRRAATPLGEVAVTLDGGRRIRRLSFDAAGAEGGARDPQLEAALAAWFADGELAGDFACDPAGTPFQKQVWAAVARLPRGRTCSYTELAAALGRPRAARAVARALATNPVLLLVPCHRVVGQDGALRGYAGGLERKRALLAMEATPPR